MYLLKFVEKGRQKLGLIEDGPLSNVIVDNVGLDA